MWIKRVLLTLLLVVFCSIANAADNQNIISKVDGFVKNKKYLQAAETLLKDDVINKEPVLFSKYVKIVTDYYVHAINFKLFAMRDLSPDENIDKIRGTKGNFSLIGGDLEEKLKEMEKSYPNNAHVRFAVGYYISRALSCGCDGGLTHYAANDESEHDYFKYAYDKKVYDEWSLFRLGAYYQQKNDLALAKKFYDLSKAEGYESPDLYYNFALIYYNNDDYQKALNSINKAIKGYTNVSLLADAFFIKGTILEKTSKPNVFQEQYRKGLELVKWHVGNFSSLATSLKKTEKRNDYTQLVKGYIALDYSNSYMFNNYIDLLEETGITTDDLEIEKHLVSLKNLRIEETGALYFNLGRFAELNNSKDEAIKRYKKSLEAFTKLKKAPNGAKEALKNKLLELEKN